MADTLEAPPQDRFCSRCGRSHVPLAVPYLSADCKDCGRTVHFIRRGDNGQGLKFEAGERLTIPANFIKLSLQPTPQGKLFRGGLPFLLNQFFIGGQQPDEHTFFDFVSTLEKGFDAYVETLPGVKGRDWTTPEDLEELTTLMSANRLSRDWYMFSASMFCGGVKWSIENGNPQRAAWAGYMLGTFRGLSIVSEPLFEETLWRGYLANEVVYEAAAAAGNRSPAELEALKHLRPLFAQFDEPTLHVLVDSGLPIGPKIGVTHLPEELLRSLAKHQLASIERERQEAKERETLEREEERLRRKEKREETDLRVKWFAAGVGAASALVALGALVWNMWSSPIGGNQGSSRNAAASAPSTSGGASGSVQQIGPVRAGASGP